MRIAILGGTGDLGRGLALRWSSQHDIVIGSRDENKSKALANEYNRIAKNYYGNEMKGSITGEINAQAIKISDVVVFSVPYKNLIDISRSMRTFFSDDKIIISPVVPMEKEKGCFTYCPYSLNNSFSSYQCASAAEIISNELQTKRVVATLNTLSATRLSKLDLDLDYNVMMTGDDVEAIRHVSELVSQIRNLHPIYIGPLKITNQLESLTPLLLNIKLHNKSVEFSIKIG